MSDFIPMNELDRAIKAMARSQAGFPDFCRALCKGELWALIPFHPEIEGEMLEIKNGAAAAVTYSNAGDKWTAGSKNIDNTSLQNLIDKLRDLTASTFVEQGGGQAVFEASVESKGSAKVEHVIVNKQGDKYFAQREGEPSIYELDAKAVEDLEKAATDVKEAAPEPKKKK